MLLLVSCAYSVEANAKTVNGYSHADSNSNRRLSGCSECQREETDSFHFSGRSHFQINFNLISAQGLKILPPAMMRRKHTYAIAWVNSNAKVRCPIPYLCRQSILREKPNMKWNDVATRSRYPAGKKVARLEEEVVKLEASGEAELKLQISELETKMMVLLMSLKAGGVGINLTAASNAFVMSVVARMTLKYEQLNLMANVSNSKSGTTLVRTFLKGSEWRGKLWEIKTVEMKGLGKVKVQVNEHGLQEVDQMRRRFFGEKGYISNLTLKNNMIKRGPEIGGAFPKLVPHYEPFPFLGSSKPDRFVRTESICLLFRLLSPLNRSLLRTFPRPLLRCETLVAASSSPSQPFVIGEKERRDYRFEIRTRIDVTQRNRRFVRMRRFVRTEEKPATATSSIGSSVDLALLVVFPVSWAFQSVVVVRMVVEVETLRNHLLLTDFKQLMFEQGLTTAAAGSLFEQVYITRVNQAEDRLVEPAGKFRRENGRYAASTRVKSRRNLSRSIKRKEESIDSD
ncbi:hypothetical protein LXL04_017557 [Taraxacum kok-saghyz]